jgi:hypothetical protein
MPQPTQNLKNHARYVPMYHLVTFGILMAVLVRAVRNLALHPSVDAGFDVALGVALVLLAWYARGFALTVQDRVIRLEMKLRLRELAPAQAARFAEFTPSQLTALRFAGDAELPGLAQQVLDGKLATAGSIKAQVQDWQADHLRA